MKNKFTLYSAAIILLSLGIFLYSFKSSTPTVLQTKITYELGFCIKPSAISGVVTYALLKIDSATKKIIGKTPLTEANFVMYSKGIIKNKANRKRVDFFAQKGIDCGLILDYPKMDHGTEVQDTLWEEMKPICLPIYDIWKLRYSIHPRYGRGASEVPDEDKGWASNRWFPSDKQTIFLQKYGIKTIYNFFYGDKMYDLFKDMQSSEWIYDYKKMI